MEQLDKELDIWDVLVPKAIAIESKAGFQLSYVIRDIDSHYLCGNWPAHNTTAQVQTQGTSIKNPRVENPWPKPHEPKAQAFQRFDNIETSKRARRGKKKNDRRNKKDWQLWDQERSTTATEVNSTDLTWRSRDNQPWKADKDLIKIICYKCNKKCHYANRCPKPLKPKN